MQSLNLIRLNKNNMPSEITAFYKGHSLTNLNKTTIIIWNNGNDILDKTSLLDSDPIKILLKDGCNIFNYEIIRQTNKYNNLQVGRVEGKLNELLLSFEYLDPQDGVTIEILHDSTDKYPTISGTIKGIPKGFENYGTIRKYIGEMKLFNAVYGVKVIYIAYISAFIGALMMIAGIIIPIDQSKHPIVKIDEIIFNNPIFSIIMGVFYILPSLYIIWSKRTKYPKSLGSE